MKRFLLLALPIALAVAAFWGTFTLLNSPRYTLYQVTESLRDGDLATFLAYVDLPRILAEQAPAAIGKTADDKAQNQNNLRQALQGVLSSVVASNPQLVQGQFKQAMANLDAEQLPSPFIVAYAATVRQSGERALVVFADPERGDRVRMGMVRKDGVWRIMHVDKRDVQRLWVKYGSGEAAKTFSGAIPSMSATPVLTATPAN